MAKTKTQSMISDTTKAHLSSVLLKPKFTEKAVRQNMHRVYTFLVSPRATKSEIKKAVEMLFKVTPVKVTTMVKKAVSVNSRGRKGTSKSSKTACVFLKKGDVINFV